MHLPEALSRQDYRSSALERARRTHCGVMPAPFIWGSR